MVIGRRRMMTKIVMKTGRLLPILVIGLAMLMLVEPPTPASGQSPTDVTPVADAPATGLESALNNIEETQTKEAETDDSQGTY
jgi:hypothetical protein